MVKEACDASGSFDKSREGKKLQDGGVGGAPVWTSQRRCLWRVKLKHVDEKTLIRRKWAGPRLRGKKELECFRD